MEVSIDEKQFEEAIERHEKAWNKELEEVDIRAVVLKTKKAVLEQSLVNTRCQNTAIEHEYKIRELSSKVNSFSHQVKSLESQIKQSNEVFRKAIDILEEHQKQHIKQDEERKGFFRKFWEFFKCLMK